MFISASSFRRPCAQVFGICFSRSSSFGIFVGVCSFVKREKKENYCKILQILQIAFLLCDPEAHLIFESNSFLRFHTFQCVSPKRNYFMKNSSSNEPLVTCNQSRLDFLFVLSGCVHVSRMWCSTVRKARFRTIIVHSIVQNS